MINIIRVKKKGGNGMRRFPREDRVIS